MSNEIVVGLEKLSALLSSQDRWTQKVCARGQDTLPCLALSPQAACFCLYGGIIRVTQDQLGPKERLVNFLAALLPESKYSGAVKLTGFNDHHTYQEVKQLVDQALAKAKGLPAPGGQEIDEHGNVLAEGITTLPLIIPTEKPQ